MKFIYFILFFLFTPMNQSFSLVDYSTEENIVPNRPKKTKVIKSNRSRKKKKVSRVSRAKTNSRSDYSPSGMFDMSFTYGTIDVSTLSSAAKVNVAEVKGHFNTGSSIYLDFKYWMANTDSAQLAKTSDAQGGNPEILLGINWLSFGQERDQTNINLFFGARLKASKSDLGSTRTDKVIGVSTIKRLNQFALGIAYRLDMSGTPENEFELNIGNRQKLSANLGWKVSHDIQFEIEAAIYKINRSNSVIKPNVLEEDDSYGAISPSLGLRLSPMVTLNLGATFISSRLKNKNRLLGARLWDTPGIYGNSINSSLSISI